jgi:hypothetical protein
VTALEKRPSPFSEQPAESVSSVEAGPQMRGPPTVE